MLHFQQDFDLTKLNSFGLKVSTHHFTELKAFETLAELYHHPIFKKERHFVLGGGSNILFQKNYDGLIIKNSLKGFDLVSEDEESVLIKIGAGENWHETVRRCISKGWGGIENLSLIPGLVGAAPIQNIGAYGVELSDVFVELNAFSLKDGNSVQLPAKDCQFGYRTSIFKTVHKGEFLITDITLKLEKKHQLNLSYGDVERKVMELSPEPTIQTVSDVICAIRRSKLPDPQKTGNAGSFFKNAIVSAEIGDGLREKYPSMPVYPAGKNQMKIPTGWLIEQCGFKGKTVGNTGTYPQQALVLVNHGDASGEEIVRFAKEIQAAVFNKFGIQIEAEVNIV